MKTHSKEAHLLADSILKAAGSGLVHYTMQKTRDEILDMAQAGIDSARKKPLEALEQMYKARTANEIENANRAARIVMAEAKE